MFRPTYAALPLLVAAGAFLYPGAGTVSAPRIAAFRPCKAGSMDTLKIAATTDVHGRIRGWDYYENRAELNRGLTRTATVIDSIRKTSPGRVLLVDAGDLLQGNPLAYVAARVTRDSLNPIIAAMNAMQYDAAVIGNHEFNYGVPYLNSAIAQARFPFLAANVTATAGKSGRSGWFGKNAYTATTVIERRGIRIGIVGATTPGSNLWDAENLARAGLRVDDILPAVARSVRTLRRDGAEVVVVLLHSGLNEPSSYDSVSTSVASENVAARVAAEVNGIDVVVYGHSHKENGGQLIGRTLVIQPKNWATSVAVASLPVSCNEKHRWVAAPAIGSLVQSGGHPENVAILGVTDRVHRETVQYVTSPVGSTNEAWAADSARTQDTPLIDFILDVERRAANADLASSAAFDVRARMGPGSITVAQLAQLYPYDNTLRAIRISGTQLRAYLDFSSRYYKTNPAGAFVVDTSIAGYNFDIVSGAEYTLDLTRPVGQRVATLSYHGKAVAPTDSFTFAINNYRQTGGGGYAMLRGAPVVYDRQQEIRQLLIDEVRRKKVIRQADYFVKNWSFVPPRANP